MSKPLEGIKVIEVGQEIQGPFAGLVLADMGASVIKIENRETDRPEDDKAENHRDYLEGAPARAAPPPGARPLARTEFPRSVRTTHRVIRRAHYEPPCLMPATPAAAIAHAPVRSGAAKRRARAVQCKKALH